MTKIAKGFTLIELLVVIVIIGILATLATVTLGSARAKARDARRVSDIKQIQTAVELYYNDMAAYPAAASVAKGVAMWAGSVTYMAKVPGDPSDGSYVANSATIVEGVCPAAAVTYVYTPVSTNSSYTLTYCVGGATGNITAGTHTALPGTIQ